MTLVSYAPTRATTSLLVHYGDLRSNLLSTPTPTQFLDLQGNVEAGSTALTGAYSYAAYVPPDAAVMTASGYDELMIDVEPLIRIDGSVGPTSDVTQNAFRQIAMTDKPYWIIVRCDGYGQTALLTRLLALDCALNVVNWAYQHAVSLQMTSRLLGFAFVNPDLNVVFPDGTVIDRLFQNALVQQCWSLNRAAALITSRPGDCTGLVGPSLLTGYAATTVVNGVVTSIANPNSGATLPWPILGCNPAQQDKLVVRYPTPQVAGFQPGVLAGMIAGILGTRGRDPGFPLNLVTAFVTILDEAAYAPDSMFGATNPPTWVPLVHAFVAALGITQLGMKTSALVLPPELFLPADSGVNTSGSVRASSTAGVVSIRYPSPSGALVVRAFDSNFNDIS